MKPPKINYSDLYADGIFSPSQPLVKKYLKVLFYEIYQRAHHIYALLEHLPSEEFCIVRWYDYRASRKTGCGSKTSPERYSLPEFKKSLGLFHDKDEFCVVFGRSILRSVGNLTPSELDNLYDRYGQEQCEKALRENRMLSLTPHILHTYGMTRTDLDVVRTLLHEWNSIARIKIRAEYEALKNLDCVKA